MRPVLQPDLFQRRSRGGMPLGAVQTLVDQRQFDVLQRGGARQQVVALKDEAQIVAAQQRALILGQIRHLDPVEVVVPLVGVSRQPITFIAVDLPDPLGPMMATNSPALIFRLT